MPSIKVGLNEWVIVNRDNHDSFTLWTDGLSGCVGVAIVAPPRALVTHISSEISVVDWQQGVERLFLNAIEHLGPPEFCEIVLGDDNPTALAEAVLQTLNTWAAANHARSDPSWTYPRTGFRTYVDNHGDFQLQTLTQMGHLDAWGANQNSDQGAAFVEFQGFFPGGQPAEV